MRVYKKFYLMHRNDIAGLFSINEDESVSGKILDKRLSPVPGSDAPTVIPLWWRVRRVSESRNNLEELLTKEGVANTTELLVKNLALSITDSYWICPVGEKLSWEEVNLFDNPVKSVSVASDYSFDFSNNPDGSLGGDQEKTWLYRNSEWFIKKNGETPDEHQSINEAFATSIHQRQGTDTSEYTPYKAIMEDGECKGCICRAFTGKRRELIPGLFVSHMRVKPNHLSEYENYIDICEQNGLSKIRELLEYQIETDFLLFNTDRHFQNFGILRDPETLEFLSPAPIYDTANSMSFRNTYEMSRKDILQTPITSFARSEEKLLGYITEKKCVDLLCTPDKKEVYDFYIAHGISEAKSEIIAKNYDTKRDMLNEFQHGLTISLYFEKSKSNADVDLSIKLHKELAEKAGC
ncbi:MAG: HipA domain-containing protein [Lachnospiraceae bacterium]|nr:HipA domain-containing protein [Lachnospiraceae bacterium]